MINKKINDLQVYCCDDISQIENYDKAINDNTQTWHCHHKLEIELHKEAKELKEMGLYYNRPAEELIFLTQSEHKSLHGKNKTEKNIQKQSNSLKGHIYPSSRNKKISESMQGKNNWIKGKKHIHKGEIHIMVYPEQLENYLNNGYELGLPDSIKIKRLKFNK